MTENNTTEAPTYAKGSWQETLQKSSVLVERSAKAKKTASNLLWTGAKAGIEEWLPNSDTDVSAEGLRANLIEALGAARKGDASKIVTVAVAVRENALDLTAYPNLSRAYAEAVKITKGAKVEAEEDDAAEAAIESIEAPKSTSSVDGAAALVFTKGLDGAVVALLDALGSDNEAAHRAFARALTTEIAARIGAKKQAEADEKKAAAAKAKAEAQAAKGAATPAKKAPAKAKGKTAAPSAAKAKPAPAKKAAPVVEDEAGVEESDDMFDALDEDEATTETEVVETPAPAKRPARRAVPRRK